MFEVDFEYDFGEILWIFKGKSFVNLHIIENIPMKMQYNLSNWKENTSEENYIDKNYIKIYLAPLVEMINLTNLIPFHLCNPETSFYQYI